MIKILSKDNDLLGTDMYRDDDKTIAMSFRPTVEHSVNQNADRTNNQVTVKTVHPVVNTITGVVVSTDRFFAVTKFSSLQHITNDVERALCFDNHIKFLLTARQSILDGQLPDAPLVMPAGTAKITTP